MARPPSMPDFDYWLQRYLAGEAAKKIALEAGVSEARFRRNLLHVGITPRANSEAKRLAYSRYTLEERRAVTAAANTAMRGRTRSAEARERTALTRERDGKITRLELEMADWLQQRGQRVTPQKAVGSYNLDLALEERAVAVEIMGSWHFSPYYAARQAPLATRREYILGKGWNLIEIMLPGPRRFRLRPEAADQVVAFAERVSLYPASVGEYRMIGGNGELVSASPPDRNDGSAVAS